MTGLPWYVVPADRKWFARAVISAIVVDAFDRLHLEFAPLTAEGRGNRSAGSGAPCAGDAGSEDDVSRRGEER